MKKPVFNMSATPQIVVTVLSKAEMEQRRLMKQMNRDMLLKFTGMDRLSTTIKVN